MMTFIMIWDATLTGMISLAHAASRPHFGLDFRINLAVKESNSIGRDVAQSGSALEWGSRGRWFKSSRPDQIGRV